MSAPRRFKRPLKREAPEDGGSGSDTATVCVPVARRSARPAAKVKRQKPESESRQSEDESSIVVDPDDPRPCIGCRRSMKTVGEKWSSVGLSFHITLVRKQHVWCQDCHNTWRTCYKQSFTTTLMEKTATTLLT